MFLTNETLAAIVFIILYSILLIVMAIGYATGNLKFKSRFSILLFHVVVRLASEATGCAFGVVGTADTNLLVAYFILGAEGYFSLLIASFRFIVTWEYHNSANGNSWIQPHFPPGTRLIQKIKPSIIPRDGAPIYPLRFILNALMIGNILVIAGGAILAGSFSDPTADVTTAKALRTAGQAIFLVINVAFMLCVVRAISQSRKETGRIHPTLYLLLLVWPFLLVRGVYGILSASNADFSYFNPDNYDGDSLKASFTAKEYVMGVTMEWIACVLLLSTWFTSKSDARHTDEPLEMPQTTMHYNPQKTGYNGYA